MRHAFTVHIVLLVALFAFPVGASVQRTTDDQEPVASSEFRALHNAVISADGAWMAAEERRDRGDGNVRVWSTEGDVTFSIDRGQNPRFSRDSRWVSALQGPETEGSQIASANVDRAGQTLVLLDTRDGSRMTFESVLAYDMTFASTYLLYLQSPEPGLGEGAHSRGGLGTLHQVLLNRDRLIQIGHRQPDATFSADSVREFVVHPTSDHFAYVFQDDETGGDTLHIVKWGIRAWFHGDTIEDVRWAGGADGRDDSIVLGFLTGTGSTAEDGTRRVVSSVHTWRTAESGNGWFTRVNTPD